MILNASQISLLALVISIIGIWISYRSSQSSRLLTAAEKVSKTHISMVESLLHVNMLKSELKIICGKIRSISLPPDHKPTEDRLSVVIRSFETLDSECEKMAAQIEENLDRLKKTTKKNDPIFVENINALVVEIGLRIGDFSLRTKNINILVEDLAKDIGAYTEEKTKSVILSV